MLACESWSADSSGPGVTVSPRPAVGGGLPTFSSHHELLTGAPTCVWDLIPLQPAPLSWFTDKEESYSWRA